MHTLHYCAIIKEWREATANSRPTNTEHRHFQGIETAQTTSWYKRLVSRPTTLDSAAQTRSSLESGSSSTPTPGRHSSAPIRIRRNPPAAIAKLVSGAMVTA